MGISKSYLRLIVIFIILLFSMIQIKTGVGGPDTVNYMSIAKSLGFDRNLMFNNEFESCAYPMTVSPTYHIVEQHQIGVALLWMFFINFLKSIPLTDINNTLEIVINLSEYFLGILALIFIFKIAQKFFDKRSAFLSILAVLFGTNLFNFITQYSGSSHVLSIFLTSAFLLYFYTYKERSKIDWFILGGLFGFMLMTRVDTLFYIVFPMFALLRNTKDKKFKTILIYGSIFILGFLFTYSPQIIFREIIFGKIFNFYYRESIPLLGNGFLGVLFSPSRGFFVYSPFLAVCFLIGLYYLYKKEKILAFASIIIFLAIVYGIGRFMSLTHHQVRPYGARHFLIFMPLFILSITACFERLSLRNQIIITVMSALWWFITFKLVLFGTSLDYAGLSSFFYSVFFHDVFHFIYYQSRGWIWNFFLPKFIFLIPVFFIILLLKGLFGRIKFSSIVLKRVAIYLAGGIIIYIHLLFVECYFNDQKVILELKKNGFYKNVVFGDYDKADFAEAYFGIGSVELSVGHIDSAIRLIRRALHTYPPAQEVFLDALSNIYINFPGEFKAEFIKDPDAYDYLGLSLLFFERKNFNNSKDCFKEALRLKPDIIEILKRENESYLSYRSEKVNELLNRIKEIKN